MRNKFGYGKFEIIAIILVLLMGSCYLGYTLLGNGSNLKFKSMKNSAVNFSRTVDSNKDSFHDYRCVYLQEVIDEKLLKSINNPFGRGSCDASQSKVEYVDGNSYVTLKCGDYIIDKQLSSDDSNMEIYKVSRYNLERPSDKNVEAVNLFNCLDKDNNPIYDEYYEDNYLVYLMNKEHGKNYYAINDVEPSVCKLDRKVYYRTKEKYNKEEKID